VPEGVTPLILLVFLLILLAEFVNGWTDAPNAIATVVSTRVLSPGAAVLLAVVLNTLGALSGTAVASTIGKGFVAPGDVTPATVGAAMTGIILWSTFAWRLGLPTSESHALVAGLSGAVLATSGPQTLLGDGWVKTVQGIGFSSVLGFGVSLLLMVIIFWVFRAVRPSIIRAIFSRAQIASAAFMAFSHGSNDAQKFMGAFTLTLVAGGFLPQFDVPLWVILLCATTMGLGTAVGGWRIIHTLGTRVTRLEPVHGFAAETGAATVIEIASRFGIPLSTTHTIATAIMGVGASQRLSAVRWGVAREMVLAWIVTFPACAAIGWLTGMVFNFLGWT
jgi:inorganic phosphate transporter, PiT family